ncbi:MAG: hypothetical protein Q7R50_08055, partial [Dehalococcoidales bacterium]|nr:hypothetical protein [Dehalococcoidales bacterium]
MSKKLFRGFSFLLALVVLIAVFAVPAMAFDARTGGTVTVPAGEVVNGDLYLAGSTLIVDGTVNGDIFGAGQSLTINGIVNGGVTFFGQTMV